MPAKRKASTTKKAAPTPKRAKASAKKGSAKKPSVKRTTTLAAKVKGGSKLRPVSRGSKKKAVASPKAKAAAGSHTALAGKLVDKVKIKHALVSVSDKAGLIPLATELAKNGCVLLSTGGTAKHMRDAGLEVKDVSEHTQFPEIMNGRVKSLHPLIHGGLLGVRGNKVHEKEMQAHGILPIDIVIVNLYPFAETIKKGADFATAIENIDIGGPSMVRSAAKNNAAVLIVTDPKQYDEVINELKSNKGAVSNKVRRKFAAAAFTQTAAYDTAISKWFNKQV